MLAAIVWLPVLCQSIAFSGDIGRSGMGRYRGDCGGIGAREALTDVKVTSLPVNLADVAVRVLSQIGKIVAIP